MQNLEILENLISFNTIYDKENKLINKYVSEYLKKLGFKITKIYNEEKNKYCLVSTYKNNINLTFSGHTDTVDVEGSWNVNPFELEIKENKIYGLGTCDMKGGIAAFLEALGKVDLLKLNKGIQVILTYDEETNFEGINLIKNNKIETANNIVIGEPTDLVPVIGTKGCIEYEVIFKGISTHSSEILSGENAIEKCNSYINELLNFSNELKNNINERFSIPYTTMNIGIIEGGKSINVVPNTCKLSFDFRTINKKQHDIINKKIEKLSNKYNAEYNKVNDVYPILIKSESEIDFLETLTNKKTKCFNYVTEGSFYDKDNIIILGPGPMNAHKTNEYIDLESYEKTIEIYIKLIKKYCK